jgi:hypothetical protein
MHISGRSPRQTPLMLEPRLLQTYAQGTLLGEHAAKARSQTDTNLEYAELQ